MLSQALFVVNWDFTKILDVGKTKDKGSLMTELVELAEYGYHTSNNS